MDKPLIEMHYTNYLCQKEREKKTKLVEQMGFCVS